MGVEPGLFEVSDLPEEDAEEDEEVSASESHNSAFPPETQPTQLESESQQSEHKEDDAPPEFNPDISQQAAHQSDPQLQSTSAVRIVSIQILKLHQNQAAVW